MENANAYVRNTVTAATTSTDWNLERKGYAPQRFNPDLRSMGRVRDHQPGSAHQREKIRQRRRTAASWRRL